jgi:hypothetical protein
MVAEMGSRYSSRQRKPNQQASPRKVKPTTGQAFITSPDHHE